MKCNQLFASILMALAALTMQAALVINEASYGGGTYPDENGETPGDWIELYNSGPNAVNIDGYWITDSGAGSTATFPLSSAVELPNYVMPAGGFLVIFPDGTSSITWANIPDAAAIPANSTWRYYAENAEPASTWKNTTFNDSAWQSGTVPMGHNIATLDMDCATVISNSTAYFRKTFTVQTQGTVTGLLVNARLNDGAVLYINGTKVKSINMPATVTHTTPASANAAPTLWQTFTLPASYLASGSNVFAVEVHRAAGANADFTFDLSLTALVTGQVPFIHAPFSLGKGEKIHFYAPSGSRLQEFNDAKTEVSNGTSLGLATDGTPVKGGDVVYQNPTPGLPNQSNASTWTQTLAAPNFSLQPGFYETNPSVAITAGTGLIIKYTLDGSHPFFSPTAQTYSSPLTLTSAAPLTDGLAWIRTNPIEITAKVPSVGWNEPIGTVAKAVVLRAVAISTSSSRLYSSVQQGTYFIGNEFANRTLPSVSLITEKTNLFGFAAGLYIPGKHYADSPEGYGDNKWGKPHANYHQVNDKQAWERPTHLELFELNSQTAVMKQIAGMAMHGGGTRAIPQKTLYFLARGTEYGSTHFNHPLFPDVNATNYKRFLLRNSGNDWYGPDTGGVATMMKDAALQRIIAGLNLSMQAYRPVSTYINGEYWGIHNMRESFDKHYLNTRYGLDADNIDILMHEEDSTNNGKVKISRVEGDKNADEEYEALIEWLSLNGLTSPEKMQTLNQSIDIDNYTDYIIAETFFANTDWPINNCDFWRAHTNQTATCGKYGDTRWRWMLYDLDLAGEKGASYNMFDYLTSNKMTGNNEPGYLITQLWRNTGYQTTFVNRYVNLLNTTFRPERTAAIIAAAAAEIEPEIEQHFRRWGRGTTLAQWQNAVQTALTDFTATRHAVTWGHLRSHFGRGATRTVTVLNADPTGTGGSFTVNGITIDAPTEGVTDRAQWTGTFFSDMTIPVSAVADPGYVFDGWVGSTASADRTLPADSASVTLKARFRRTGDPAYTPTGYEQWQIENYTEQQILTTADAAPDAPSGLAGMSNFALYAFGMSKTDGLTDAQRTARASLSIHNQDGGLWLGHARLTNALSGVSYRILTTESLTSGNWTDAAILPLLGTTITNTINGTPAWLLDIQLRPPHDDARFFKLHVTEDH